VYTPNTDYIERWKSNTSTSRRDILFKMVYIDVLNITSESVCSRWRYSLQKNTVVYLDVSGVTTFKVTSPVGLRLSPDLQKAQPISRTARRLYPNYSGVDQPTYRVFPPGCKRSCWVCNGWHYDWSPASYNFIRTPKNTPLVMDYPAHLATMLLVLASTQCHWMVT
jgi:hypothetical protein